MMEDLKWCGFNWTEGPDLGGPSAPYEQSARIETYQAAFIRLLARGDLYPCYCSRKDIRNATTAPHQAEDEIIYPQTCRPELKQPVAVENWQQFCELNLERDGRRPAWRFRTNPQSVEFDDGFHGSTNYLAGKDFGDFVVWRQDDVPSYQLACSVDDLAMNITEVVRGADLMISTARQILLIQALQGVVPQYLHCPLMLDAAGNRLAKRVASHSLREMRKTGKDPEQWFTQWKNEFAETLRVRTGE
jgi:glutamyl-tRNA synthetase